MHFKEYRNNVREPMWRALADAAGEGGSQIAAELRELYEIYDDSVLDWYVSLYDAKTGGFYYSVSARDNDFVEFNGKKFPLLPDFESTIQAFEFLSHSGMTKNFYQSLPKTVIDKATEFIKGMQHENGYFYHPQWGKEEVDKRLNRRARDLVWAANHFRNIGAMPKYDTPNGLKGESSLVSEKTEEAPKPEIIHEVPKHLENKRAFMDYLDSLDMANRSYHCGNMLVTQLSQITQRDKELSAAGESYSLLQICVDWLDERIHPETGHWHSKADYYGVNGFLKTHSMYNAAGRPIPYPEAAAQSTIDAIASAEPMTAVVDVFNAWWAFAGISYNLRHFGGEGGNARADAILKQLHLGAPAAIRGSKEKIARFKKADGSFSYLPTMSSPTSQDMPVAIYGTNEGDINATGISINGYTNRICDCLGLHDYKPPMFMECDFERYLEMLKAKL